MRWRFHLDNLRRLLVVVGYHVDALFVVDFVFRDDVLDVSDFLALVRRQQMLLQERFVAEASIAVHALRDF